MLSDKATLAEWLAYIESTHHQNIDMGLTRSRKVFMDMDIHFSKSCVITVAGTNGKGSTCRFIEQACLQAGLKVGVYSSPHITAFNERIRIDGHDVSDQAICEAFSAVEQAKQNTSLTYFEYATLAAFWAFAQNELNVIIIEVGLGGRLDATNIVDADIGVITSIGLDHQAYLGDTTNDIAREKAGIIKPNQQVVVGYAPVHNSVLESISSNNAVALFREQDFDDSNMFLANGQTIHFNTAESKIPLSNVMTAIATLKCMAKVLKVDETLLLAHNDLQALINEVSMPGRLQVLSTQPYIVLDVAHNEAAAELVVKKLQQMSYARCHIVIGMLKDKNIEATLKRFNELSPYMWYCVDLPSERGEKAARFVPTLISLQQSNQCFSSLKEALQAAIDSAIADDLILVVGSFIVAQQCMLALATS